MECTYYYFIFIQSSVSVRFIIFFEKCDSVFQFSNLLGTVYKKGNLSFTPDGNSVVSPVGNRISIFDLKK